jgi:two-component system chemotaxis sensor kinase CheA
LFRAGSFERLAVPLSLVARLEEFPLASIERAGGSQVVQYRNCILPLVPLRDVLEPNAQEREQAEDPAQVIVFSEGDRSVGLIVDQILDVAEEAVTVRQASPRKGLLGSAVVGKRVADFLDLNYVLRASAQDWFDTKGGATSARMVLVADDSAFCRGLIRSGLDMAGYRVLEAANLEEATRELEQHPVDVVAAALDLSPDGISALRSAMGRRPEWEGIPVLALAKSAGEWQTRGSRESDFQDCQAKFDRDAVVGAVARLLEARTSIETAPDCAGKESN